MSIFSKVGEFISGDTFKNGVREMMVSRPVDNNDLIWKYPDQAIPMFAQCTVRADEWAVFSKEGRPVGTLDTGRCTLSPANVPFLSNFVDHYTDGNSLMTELSFVRRTPYAVPVGGTISLLDPLTKVRLHPKCTGTVVVRVVNPESLIYCCFSMHQIVDQKEMLERIADVALTAMRSAALRLASLQSQPILSVLDSPHELTAALVRECDELLELGLRFVEVSEFKYDLPQRELEAVRSAMQQPLTSDQHTSKDTSTAPPLVRQIFERGIREGELRSRREILLRMLSRAGLMISDEDRKSVMECSSALTLDRWIDNLFGAKTPGDVFR